MEKIIFFGLVIPIMSFVLYLGATAIMKGFAAKEEKRSEKEANSFEDNQESLSDNLSDELSKLNNLKTIINQNSKWVLKESRNLGNNEVLIRYHKKNEL